MRQDRDSFPPPLGRGRRGYSEQPTRQQLFDEALQRLAHDLDWADFERDLHDAVKELRGCLDRVDLVTAERMATLLRGFGMTLSDRAVVLLDVLRAIRRADIYEGVEP